MDAKKFHPPITRVHVFSTEEQDTVRLSGRLEAFKLCFFRKYYRPSVGDFLGWNEYIVDKWQETFPDGAIQHLSFLVLTPCCGRGTVFFADCDQYGYFRESEECIQNVGYSIREGSSCFVNFLAQPATWSPRVHQHFTPIFRAEVFQLLLVLYRVFGFDKCNKKDIASVIIQHLAQIHYRGEY